MPIKQQPKERSIKGVMDIVICVDATGSMTPCIEGLKNNLKGFIRALSSSPGGVQQIKPDWRAKIIWFRDLEVDADALKEFDFVDNEDDLRVQIESIRAEGGGDEPESLLDALYVAIAKSQWRDNALHAVVAFTDAPPKKELSETTIEPGQAKDLGTIINAFVRDKYQKLWIFCPSGKEDKNYDKFEENYMIYSELEKIPRSQIKYVDGKNDVYSGLQNIDFTKLLDELGKTITLSSSEVLKA